MTQHVEDADIWNCPCSECGALRSDAQLDPWPEPRWGSDE